MEHTDAVKLQAVEKYILGELTPSLREEFEAHYFDCTACALNLRTGVAFAAVSRQYFAESSAPAAAPERLSPGWFAWLRPSIAVPVLAALLIVVGYQNLITIPNLHRTTNSEAVAVEPWFSLVVTHVRGSASPTLQVLRGQGFLLLFDITAAHSDPDANFVLQLTDSSGKTVLSRTVSGQTAQKSVALHVPPGLSEGEYRLLILKQRSGSSTASVGEIAFAIAFSGKVKQD